MRPVTLLHVAAATATLLAVSGARGQTTWSRTYGGAARFEGILDAREAADGSLLVAAVTDSFGTATGDAWLLRLDGAGNVLSEAVVGDATAGAAEGAVLLPDGGAIFSGRNVRDIFTPHDGWATRVAPDGGVTWALQFARPVGRFFMLDWVHRADGGLLVAGQASPIDAPPIDAWIVAFGIDGTMEWQRRYGSGTFETVNAVAEAAGGGFVFAGVTTGAGAGSTDAWILKTDALGNEIWQVVIGGGDQDEVTDLAQLADGTWAFSGFTNSFSASGHSGWVVRLADDGTFLWHAVVGDTEWGDLYGVTATSDGELVVLGRIFDGLATTNELWAAKLDAVTAAVEWQHAYEGLSGDWGEHVVQLSDGGFLLAGTWAWGFPEEDLFVVRTDAAGLLEDCTLLRDTTVTLRSPRVVVGRGAATLQPAPDVPAPIPLVESPGGATVTTYCEAPACPALSCDDIVVEPLMACAGQDVTLTAVTSGGVGPYTVEWDFDGDTMPEATGGTVTTATLPAGMTTVSVTVTDSCGLPVPTRCGVMTTVTVVPAIPPGEVSDVRAGAPPLLVLPGGDRLQCEERLDARAYNHHVDAIGSWYFPAMATGSACTVSPVTSLGSGSVEMPLALPVDSWVVVTASADCGEGPPGRDSFGGDRAITGTWEWCGASP